MISARSEFFFSPKGPRPTHPGPAYCISPGRCGVPPPSPPHLALQSMPSPSTPHVKYRLHPLSLLDLWSSGAARLSIYSEPSRRVGRPLTGLPGQAQNQPGRTVPPQLRLLVSTNLSALAQTHRCGPVVGGRGGVADTKSSLTSAYARSGS